jgi:hypothetical protein
VHFQAVFAKVAEMSVVSQDVEVIQNSILYLKRLVSVGYAGLSGVHVQGKNAVDILISVIQRLLHPSVDESIGLFVGKLARTLLLKDFQRMQPFSQALLTHVFLRLVAASRPDFVQELVMIVLLFMYQDLSVLDYLATLHHGGQTGDKVFLKVWVENQELFSGYECIKLSALCLVKFVQGFQARWSIDVKGDLVVEESKLIRTRSRAKSRPETYTSVSVLVKAVKLLVNEVGQEATRGVGGKSAENSDSEDEEWEDLNDGTGPNQQSFDSAEDGMEFLANINLHSVLKDFFAGLSKHPGFQGLSALLTESEKEILSLLFN